MGQVLGAATTAAAARLPAVDGVGAAAIALVAAACLFGVAVNAVVARRAALGAGPLVAAGLLSSATTAMTSNIIITPLALTGAAVTVTAAELLLQNFFFFFSWSYVCVFFFSCGVLHGCFRFVKKSRLLPCCFCFCFSCLLSSFKFALPLFHQNVSGVD